MHRRRSRGFTLVELLVVIAIIGVLAGLITVAVVGALKNARQSQIKIEVNQLADGFEDYKIRVNAYPPNCQTSALALNHNSLDVKTVVDRFKRHLKKAFPRHQEDEDLINLLSGVYPHDLDYAPPLSSGISAGEAIVFWLGGFSDDPRYPISGEGGPSYLASLGKQDPIGRSWTFPCEVSWLIPRDSDGYFDESHRRYIEYPDPRFPKDHSKRRRINFWQYVPKNSQQPYLYFDVSRGEPTLTNDPPSLTTGGSYCVYTIKSIRRNDSRGNRIFNFANDGKFQILHCGRDDIWGDPVTQLYGCITPDPGPEYQNILRLDTDANGRITAEENKVVLVFPGSNFPGDMADTVVNFTTATRIDEAQE